MKLSQSFDENGFSQLCLKEKNPYFDENPPFNLLLNPKSFLAAEISGINPEETEFVDALVSEDPRCTSIMLDFLSYERKFVKNVNFLIKILMSLIGIPIFKALPEAILSYSRNVLEEHKLFLMTLENVLKNHSKIFIIEFIETLAHVEQLIESHQKYNFHFTSVESIANQLSIGEVSPQVISKINQLIEENMKENEIYNIDKSTHNKTENKQQQEQANQNQNSTNVQNQAILFGNHAYHNNTILIHYFKLPIKWQNYSIDASNALLQTKPFQSLPDPQLTKTLKDFIKHNENLNSSLESIPKLTKISKMFLKESFPIVVSGRRFLREGKALKQCRKCTSERVLLLFSDIFVYVQSKSGCYLVPRIYRLSYLRIESHMHPTNTSSILSLFSRLNNKDKTNSNDANKAETGRPTIYFFAPRKSFILIFSSVKERDSWYDTLNEAIESSKSNMIVPKYSEAPLWIPNDVVSRCMNCKAQFSLTLRKHHCRGCGQVMCKKCIAYQVMMKNISYNKPVKVCKKCYTRINEERIRKENFKKTHPGQKDEEEIMISNLNKLIPQMYESSSDTTEDDTSDIASLLGCP